MEALQNLKIRSIETFFLHKFTREFLTFWYQILWRWALLFIIVSSPNRSGKQCIDPKRFICKFARLSDPLSEHRRATSSCPKNSQSSGVRDCRCQCGATRASHARQNNRLLNFQNLTNPCRQIHIQLHLLFK